MGCWFLTGGGYGLVGIGLCGSSAVCSIEGGAGEDVVDGLRRRNKTVTTTAATSPRRAVDVRAMGGDRQLLATAFRSM